MQRTYVFTAHGNASGNTADAEKVVSIFIETMDGGRIPADLVRAGDAAAQEVFFAAYGQAPRRSHYYAARPDHAPSGIDAYVRPYLVRSGRLNA